MPLQIFLLMLCSSIQRFVGFFFFLLKTDIWGICQPELYFCYLSDHYAQILTLGRSLSFCFAVDMWILFEELPEIFSSSVGTFRLVSDLSFILKTLLERIIRVTSECERTHSPQLGDGANTKMVLIWRQFLCVSNWQCYQLRSCCSLNSMVW